MVFYLEEKSIKVECFYNSTFLTLTKGERMRIPSDKAVADTLDKIEERRRIVETSVRSVTQGFCPALFLWGAPGLGKSHMLTSMLDGLIGKSWKHHTAYSTPKGLMLSLAENPSAIHVFEDCEKMLKTDLSASLLRAACGAPGDRERWVTYETATETLRVKVTGGIIIVTNANLSRQSGPMQGVASRFRPIKWELTQDEVVAVILSISKRPFVKQGVLLTPAECKKVALALLDLIEESKLAISLDVRLFTEHALPCYAFCKMTSDKNWEDVLQAKLVGTCETKQEGQADRTNRLESLAAQIAAGEGTSKEKVQKWKSLSGLGQAIYYRHLKKTKGK